MKTKLSFVFSAIAMLATSVFTVAEAQWSLSGNSNATATSKLGTTNAFPVRIFTNNAERVTVTPEGRIGIGTTNPINILTVKTGGGTPSGNWTGVSTQLFFGFSESANGEFNIGTATDDATHRSLAQLKRSRGTLASPKVVQNNDYLASVLASGYDGSAFQNPAEVDFYVDGTPSAGHVPGRISFVTGTNGSDRTERLKVGSTGNFNFNSTQLAITQATGDVSVGVGKLGVGTTAPTNKLHVIGDNTTNSVGQITTAYTGNADVRALTTYSKPADGYGYGIQSTGGYIGGYLSANSGAYTGGAYGVYGYATGTAGTHYGVFGYATGGTENWGGYFSTKTYANEIRVGGLTGATGYVAAINGKLIATEVRVEAIANWPDYVFNKGYKLMSIDDLEAKVNLEKHLPGIPAADKVKDGGIMLGEMQTKTIEKVEENTLYIIQLNNKIKQLEKVIDELTKKIK